MIRLILMVLSISICGQVYSNDLSVEEIIARANQASFYAGDDGRSDARMMIVDAQGNKQMRQFVIYRKDIMSGEVDNGDQNFLVVFSRPSDVNGTVFLVHKKAEGDDDRWLYLPALDLEKRIAASDNRSSFVGSDFFYEDVSGRHPKADVHEVTSQDGDFYAIKSTPKDADAVEFSYYTMNIDKQTFLPIEVSYFDKQGKKYRQVEVLKVEEVQGHATVMQSKVSNLNTGGHTLMAFRNPQYDVGLTEADFTSRALKNPPRK
ncbi:outer membrane lipoprotein-sorting protein [Marinicella rhabdoformis]|uniref:outer membrane lipoprotein-sorting protein n=1 Tax=Marinicella rhabdoformis TaxID=2580566 RepID=UPI0012AEBA0B|nr:outer membrane lipoprotein-sorting protein [Marinicella rhabdoformis]